MITKIINESNENHIDILNCGHFHLVGPNDIEIKIAPPNYKNFKNEQYIKTVKLPIKIIVTKTIIFKILE